MPISLSTPLNEIKFYHRIYVNLYNVICILFYCFPVFVINTSFIQHGRCLQNATYNTKSTIYVFSTEYKGLCYQSSKEVLRFSPLNIMHPCNDHLTAYKKSRASTSTSIDSIGNTTKDGHEHIWLRSWNNSLNHFYYKYCIQYHFHPGLYSVDKKYLNTSLTKNNWDPLFYAIGKFTHGATTKKEGETPSLVVVPVLLQTFGVETLMVVSGTIYAFYHFRLRKKRDIEKIRNHIARDLHDEVGSTLSAIAIYSKVAHEQSKQGRASPEQLLGRINENVQHAMEVMSEIVWNISTKNDDFENIIIHMREHAAHLLGLRGYEVFISIDEDLNQFYMSMEDRQNFYLIFKEAINNIVKYACGKTVWISLRKKKGNLLLVVKDNGIGFDEEQTVRNGNGLVNMKDRATLIHGKLTIISRIGHGTEIQLNFPIVK
jgi:hypothetical protein